MLEALGKSLVSRFLQKHKQTGLRPGHHCALQDFIALNFGTSASKCGIKRTHETFIDQTFEHTRRQKQVFSFFFQGGKQKRKKNEKIRLQLINKQHNVCSG